MFPASQEFGDVLHAAHGYASQVHLNERLLHGRFPAPVALYDGCLERGQAQFWDGDVELSRATDERFQVVLESGFVDLPHTPLSGICEGEYALPGFPDGESALMLVCARLRHVASKEWGTKRYLNMKHLYEQEKENELKRELEKSGKKGNVAQI